MNSSCKRATSAPVAVIVLVLTLGLLPAAGQAEIELVAVIPPSGGITPEFVDGIEVIDNDPNKIVFVTRNQGARCGGGTAASAWKMTLDPVTGQALTLSLKQPFRPHTVQLPSGGRLPGNGHVGSSKNAGLRISPAFFQRNRCCALPHQQAAARSGRHLSGRTARHESTTSSIQSTKGEVR